MSTSDQSKTQGVEAKRWRPLEETYSWIFVERAVGASLEFDLVEAKLIEHAICIVKMACLGANKGERG